VTTFIPGTSEGRGIQREGLGYRERGWDTERRFGIQREKIWNRERGVDAVREKIWNRERGVGAEGEERGFGV